MTLSAEDRDLLIRYNLEKSQEAVSDVDFLINNHKYELAISRIYYGIYYSLSALALKHEFSTRKHAELIGWFNKHFVKDKKVSQSIGKIVRYAFEMRSEADYDVTAHFSKEQTNQAYQDMKMVIDVVKQLINQ